MSRPKGRKDRKRPGESATEGGRGAAQVSGDRKSKRTWTQRFVAWYQAKSPILRFVVGLGLLMTIANLILMTDRFETKIMPSYLRGWAQISASVLRVLGEDAAVSDSLISSPRFSVSIKKGCDAVQPTVLFITAVLASPVAFRPKLPGLAIGILFLMAMNLVRVISLYYIGVYWPSAFEIMHHDVWQATFIIVSIVAWALWAVWAVRETTIAANVPR